MDLEKFVNVVNSGGWRVIGGALAKILPNYANYRGYLGRDIVYAEREGERIYFGLAWMRDGEHEELFMPTRGLKVEFHRSPRGGSRITDFLMSAPYRRWDGSEGFGLRLCLTNNDAWAANERELRFSRRSKRL